MSIIDLFWLADLTVVDVVFDVVIVVIVDDVERPKMFPKQGETELPDPGLVAEKGFQG